MPSALIVGVGGLGCSAAPVLAEAGVALTLCDFDRIEERNLGRQDLYTSKDIGWMKVEIAAERLPVASVHAEPFRPEMVDGHDVVLDCTDEPGTRALIHQSCLERSVPLAWAGVAGDMGQVAVVLPGNGPCLRCLWTGVGEPQPCDANTAADALRATGRRQGECALEVLQGQVLAGTLELIDEPPRTIRFERRSDCAACSNL